MPQLHFWPTEVIPSKIFFHADFDGICSAAVLGRFFNADIELEPVDYRIKKLWLRKRLSNAAVVDFPFHPEALWWFDHHTTTFLSDELRKIYVPSPRHRWDVTYGSCPALILDVLSESTDVSELRNSLSEWVQWSEIIDSAKYGSPHQAVLGDDACILLNQALSETADPQLRVFMVTKIVEGATPTDLIEESDIQCYWAKFRERQQLGLEAMKQRLQISAGIGYCDVIGVNAPFVRYGVYYLAPNVSYSVIAYNSRTGRYTYKISLSRNPWRGDVEPLIDLGEVARKYGGGGRLHVASITFGSATECREVAKRILSELAVYADPKIGDGQR